MPISETIQYVIIFGLTIIFSVFALTMENYRLFLKMAAGTCWGIMAIIQFTLGDISSALTLGFALLCSILGLFFFASTILDWHGEKKESFAKAIEE
jgi:hypothetical protein